MLKTYSLDLPYVDRLISSFHLFNSEFLTLYLVAPAKDKAVFQRFAASTIELVFDEEIPVAYVADDKAPKGVAGILNAGISKLGFYKLGVTEHYFVIDSDMVFLRPFGETDFLTPEKKPYLFVSECLHLKADPFYYSRYWAEREEAERTIHKVLSINMRQVFMPHSGQVFSSKILSGLEDFISRTHGHSFANLMSTAIYEFSWYANWALGSFPLEVARKDEIVKVIHHQGEHLFMRENGVTSSDLSRSYLGVIVNSNWSRQYGVVEFDCPPTKAYLSQGKWAEWRTHHIT